MALVISAKRFDRQRLLPLTDWLAVGVAVVLPWSTSVAAILIVLWLAAYVATMDVGDVWREVRSAAGGLPVLLWLLAAIGMLWADVGWHERIVGLGGFYRLLAIPLLLAQFRRSDRGAAVLIGFLASTTCLLFVSWTYALIPALATHGNSYGVPVKDYIWQSGIFLLCAFALIDMACRYWRERNIGLMFACIALAALFVANIAFVATGRTTFVAAPALVAVVGYRNFGGKGLVAACLAAVALAGALWLASPYLRQRAIHSYDDLRAFYDLNQPNSTALHLEFLLHSTQIMADAPLFGHGTGSIAAEFRRVTAGESGAAGVASVNPHNQTFAVAIQLGLIGAAVLWGMWLSHLMLFRGGGPPAAIGMLVVVQNIAASLFNSHLFDFSQGWLYVFGVGVAGGMALRAPKFSPEH